ncbi:MAG: alpha-galactosidase, partial [Bacteroidaceae bacterium]|nr:alpha-galactosidase [Bacteroidaceae bacterium]
MLTACQGNASTEEPQNSSETAHFLPPLMGWSSWNTYHVNISEALIKSQANAMVSTGLKDAGYLYINTDDGFFGWRDETGLMHTHPDRFPNGMKPVA